MLALCSGGARDTRCLGSESFTCHRYEGGSIAKESLVKPRQKVVGKRSLTVSERTALKLEFLSLTNLLFESLAAFVPTKL